MGPLQKLRARSGVRCYVKTERAVLFKCSVNPWSSCIQYESLAAFWSCLLMWWAWWHVSLGMCSLVFLFAMVLHADWLGCLYMLTVLWSVSEVRQTRP